MQLSPLLHRPVRPLALPLIVGALFLLIACKQFLGHPASAQATTTSTVRSGTALTAAVSEKSSVQSTTGQNDSAQFSPSFPLHVASSSSATPPPVSTFLPGDCLMNNLTVSTHVSVARNSVDGVVIFTNQSSASCTMHGFPLLVMATAASHLLPTSQSYVGPDHGTVQVPPKGTATVSFSWQNWCAAAHADDLLLNVAIQGQNGYMLTPLQTSLGAFIRQTPTCTNADLPTTLLIQSFGS